MSEGWFWVKLSGLAVLSSDAPGFDDVKPFHDRLVAANAERLLRESDWPHTRNRSDKPSTEDLLASLLCWTINPDTQEQILHRNPTRLYRLEESRV